MSDSIPTPLEDERRALKAVVNLVRLSEPLIFELWRSHELTLAQVQCLRILSIGPEQAGDLAKKLSMSSTSLTRILERLESREMVQRTLDLHDRRRIWVQLTETGQKTVTSLTSWYQSPLFHAIQEMEDAERTQLIETLNHYTQKVREIESRDVEAPTPLSEEIR